MKTADPELMRAINRLNVLDTIRRHGPIARVEISERTELSTTTVSAITASLLDDGLILPRHEGDIRNEGARGRPRVMLELNPDAARVVGAKIAASRLVFVLTDFRGDVLSKLTLPIRIDRQPITVIADLVEDGVRRCVVDAGLSLEDVDTVCLGLPGVIEHRTGHVRSSPIFRDTNVDFASEMTARLGTSTIIESDAHAITLAHHWFGKARDLEDMVLISLEQTLGLGVLHGNQLFRGAGGLSHNLGDLVLGTGSQGTVRLSSRAGESAILGEQQADGRFAEAIRLGRGMAHAQALIKAEDNVLIGAAVRAGEAVGLTIANIVTLFAPPRVILVGSSLALGEPFLNSLRDAYALAIPPSLKGVTELIFDDSTDDFWAQGAAAVALYELYESPWNTTGPAL
ncbi:ROK family transcriptional regulator [Rhizobium sp. SEMIA 4085]|uniref:ROK family transcriptional regulator protein n=1 Tax=Rhizobium gallicum bv. gallicum R602sp TaxID=1041138 RepID=A0A0B4XEL8_9HYPH|nr:MULTISPECIES: ROK family transcriptional regulator [Rhizobium]AJD45088.1 ROK family transcriptional regulator protein [Rhizobium gallicum bv. gallicum R602sp]NNH29930.1 ROK family transcriptional regulator [Rhizobium sp. SEMIA 4085]TDW27120.1 putative NBD/HSP70 family sugar kinase [Rhizobium azibense]